MAETKYDKDVQGVGIYLELRKGGSTCQILLTPDGFSKVGDKIVAPQFFRRVLREGDTKRKWRAYAFAPNLSQKDALTYGTPLEVEAVEANTELRLKNLESYFDSLVVNGFKLYADTPVYVEVTKDDLETIKTGSMPAKLWTRVKASRAALGFPEEIIDPR